MWRSSKCELGEGSTKLQLLLEGSRKISKCPRSRKEILPWVEQKATVVDLLQSDPSVKGTEIEPAQINGSSQCRIGSVEELKTSINGEAIDDVACHSATNTVRSLVNTNGNSP